MSAPGPQYPATSESLIPTGRIYRYTITSLNLPGPPPRPRGPPAWGDEPYAYTDDHKDANQSLGWSDWSKHPQCVTIAPKYLPHRAFIPLNPRNLTICNVKPWPFRRVQIPGFAENTAYKIEEGFFHDVRADGNGVRAAVNCFHLALHRLHLQPGSTFNYEWAVGDGWDYLMTKAGQVLLRSQTLDWVEEVRRRLVDAVGWMEFIMRQIVHHLALVACLAPPRWITEGRFVGVMVDTYYKDATDLGVELARFGAPVWEVGFAERRPPLELVPPGATQRHPVWEQCYRERKQKDRTTHEDSISVRRLFQERLQEMIALGQAAQPVAWFEPSRNPPSEKAGMHFADPQGVPNPRMASPRGSFLISVLRSLRISKWAQAELAPVLFQEDLSELERIFSSEVFDTRERRSTLSLSPLFAHNHDSLLSLRSRVCPARNYPWETKRWRGGYRDDIHEPGALERTVQQRTQGTPSPLDSNPLTSTAGHARPHSPPQHPPLASHAENESNSLVPSPEECVRLGLRAGDDSRYPETWSRKYGDQGLPLHLVDPTPLGYASQDFHQLNGCIYVCLEDYADDGPSHSLAAQLYDRYSSTGAIGYLTYETDRRMNVMLAYPCQKESNALALIDNQTKASLQFPHSEPSCTRPATLEDLSFAHRISPWGNLATDAIDIALARRDQRLEYFREEIHDGRSLPRKWSLDLLGPREDGRKGLYQRIEYELGVILPPLKPVTSHFFEGPIANYPKGSKFIVMQRHRLPSLDFYQAVEAGVQGRLNPVRLPAPEDTEPLVAFHGFLRTFLSARSPPSFQVPIPYNSPFHSFLSSIARRYQPSRLSSRVNLHGTHADEMLIFSAAREEFEVVLCGFDSPQSLKAKGRAGF